MTLFMGISVGASLLIGGYAVFGFVRGRLQMNGATAALLLALAFGATAGGEFVREGARKPFTVRKTLYANSIHTDEVARLRREGSTTGDRYPVRDASQYANDDLVLGARVFRAQCSVCHTIRGANGLVHLAGGWSPEQLRLNVANLQHTKPFMPPFAGTPLELDALARLIAWEASDRTKTFDAADEVELRQIERWLDEAGTEPGGRE